MSYPTRHQFHQNMASIRIIERIIVSLEFIDYLIRSGADFNQFYVGYSTTRSDCVFAG